MAKSSGTIYCNTDNVGTENGNTNATGWSTLTEAYTDIAATMTGNIIVECSGATALTSTAYLFSKNGGYRVTTRGERGVGDGHYDGTALYSTSHFRISVANNYAIVYLHKTCTTDGIQVVSNGTDGTGGIYNGGGIPSNLFEVRNCRVVTFETASTYNVAGVSSLSGPTTYENNLIYGTFSYSLYTHQVAGTYSVYNNLCIGSGSASLLLVNDLSGNTLNIKNNIFLENEQYMNQLLGTSPLRSYEHVWCSTDDADNIDSWVATVNRGYNAYDHRATAANTGDVILRPGINLADIFNDPYNATIASRDFRPKLSGRLYRAGVGSGTDSNIPTTDITGASRTSGGTDMGPFEITAPSIALAMSAGSTVGDSALEGKNITLTLTGDTWIDNH